jgi:hypothetical protein
MRIVRIERQDDVYVARDANDDIVWWVELRLDMSSTPFREEAIWPAACVVAIAGGPEVHFLSAESGQIVKTLLLGDDLFGHFGPTDQEVLYVLGWENVTAVDNKLVVRWVTREVAVDGIIWKGSEGDCVKLSAEMDPPGGWVNVELDAATGREIRRGQTIEPEQ